MVVVVEESVQVVMKMAMPDVAEHQVHSVADDAILDDRCLLACYAFVTNILSYGPDYFVRSAFFSK